VGSRVGSRRDWPPFLVAGESVEREETGED
jgi:hypothetical protein